VEDIFDGELYTDQCSGDGFLDMKSGISFTWYSDGANVFKSSKMSVWPMLLSVNELPFNKRLLKENVMAGLWCGPVKPVGNLMLSPLRAVRKNTLLEKISGTIFQTAVILEPFDLGP